MADRRDQLQLLAFFHYAVGAMMAMVAVVPLVLSAVGAQMASPGGDELIRTQGARVTQVATFGCSAALLVAGLLGGGVVAWAGRCLMERRRHRFCLFAAGLACLFLPIGTVLGAVTLSLLLAPDVRALFADA
jgi:hypothetical protein